jgi:hypothetical protein
MLFFDVVTGHLLRERTTTETSFIPLQDQVDYEDYRNVDGVMLPFRIRSSDGSPFSTSVKVFTSVRHDVDVDDATFQPPPAAKRDPRQARRPIRRSVPQGLSSSGERNRSIKIVDEKPRGD